MTRIARKTYVLCLSNEGYPASLEFKKIYELLHDAEAARKGLVRVIDESGEDYLYPQSRFAAVRLPRVAEKALAAAG